MTQARTNDLETRDAQAPGETVVVAPAAGDVYWLLGERMRVLMTGDRTGGAHAAAECTVGPGGGPPPHLHAAEDELFYVLNGELTLTLGDRRCRAVAGDAVYLPRNVVHTFTNPSPTPARFVIIATPAGFEHFVTAVSVKADAAALAAFAPPAVTPAAVERVTAGAVPAGIEFRFDHRAADEVELPRSCDQRWLLGQLVRLKLTAADTGGQFSVMEVVSPPGGGVPPHRHAAEDELFYVLEGRYAFEVDGRRVAAEAGTFLRVPRGTWHGFVNDGSVPARLLDIHTPGGFEAFARELGEPCADADAAPPAGAPDMDRVVATILRHGMELPVRAG